MFNPSRLTLARQRRGWTKRQLAESVGVTPRAVSQYENGDRSPSEESLEKLAASLQFPSAFFVAGEPPLLTPDAASFRSLRSMKAYERDMALSSGSIAVMLNQWIDENFYLPEADLPEFDEDEIDPETAAIALRNHWNLGDRPISNMVHLLESKGVRVFSVVVDAKAVDAFSIWDKNTPFVFLNHGKTAERMRFDAAHELGHLVFHRYKGPGCTSVSQEKFVDAFASAFLMPKTSILAKMKDFSGYITTQGIISLKKFWGVSAKALNYRLGQLGLVSEWVQRSIFIELSTLGYTTTEPEPMKHESSQVLAKIFATLKKEGVNRRDIANTLAVNLRDLESLVFGLVITDVSAGNAEQAKRPTPPKEFKLHLVK